MIENVVRLMPTVFQPNWIAILAIGLISLAVPTQGKSDDDDDIRDNEVRQVASKSEAGAKPTIDEDHPLYKFLEVAYKAREEVEKIEDYRCIFLKRELLKKGLVTSRMEMKFREKPFSVYLKFTDPDKGIKDPNAGRQVIYANGKYANKLMVHEVGLMSSLGWIQLAPKGPDAMADNKYDITNIGMKTMLNRLIELWEAEGKVKDGIKTAVRAESKIGNDSYTAYEVIHEPNPKFKYYLTRLWVDDVTGLAIGVQEFGFPRNEKEAKNPPIIEEYFYRQLKTNVKLTDMDFETKNPNYVLK